jgi:hypothetical protein
MIYTASDGSRWEVKRVGFYWYAAPVHPNLRRDTEAACVAAIEEHVRGKEKKEKANE